MNIPLPVLVMRDEETWENKQNYIVACEFHNIKLYTCTLHVDITSFQKDYNKKKKRQVLPFRHKLLLNKIDYHTIYSHCIDRCNCNASGVNIVKRILTYLKFTVLDTPEIRVYASKIALY